MIDFSIVTPSFNQAEFLTRTLDSVCSQKNISVQHIVVDPGSTDGSLDIIKSRNNIDFINKKDSCQSEGINNGFKECRGQFISWLNSDDVFYSDETLLKVKNAFESAPSVDIVYGKAIFINEADEKIKDYYVYCDSIKLQETLEYQVGICQPAVFWRKHVYEKIGGLDESLDFQLDYEYWIRMCQSGFKWKFVDSILSSHRWWPGMKTASQRGASLDESLNLVKQKFGYVHYKWAERSATHKLEGADGIITTKSNPGEDIYKEVKNILRLTNTDGHTINKLKHSSSNSPAMETYSWMLKNGMDLTEDFIDTTKVEIDEKSIRFFCKGDENQPSTARRPIIFTSKEKFEMISYGVSSDFSIATPLKKFQYQLEVFSEYLNEKRIENRGKSCVVVANGPSLKHSLSEELFKHDLIISNFAYKHKDLLNHAKYFTVANHTVAEQIYADWNKLEKIKKIMPFWIGRHIPKVDNVFYLNATVVPEFSRNILEYISWRSTVSYFNIQLANALGYKNILLVGFDNSYIQPADVKEGDKIVQTTDDPNHFIGNYFKGKYWQAADTGNMTQSYIECLKFSLSGHTNIFNCTEGGKLEIFPRKILSDFSTDTTEQQDNLVLASDSELFVAANTPDFLDILNKGGNQSFYEIRHLVADKLIKHLQTSNANS